MRNAWREEKGFGDAPQQAYIFKNPDQGFYENMVSVSTLTLLAILRIVGSEAGRQPCYRRGCVLSRRGGTS